MAEQMVKPRGKGDWNAKYRSCTFDEMLGQGIISMMMGAFLCRDNLPHALLFTGLSGCGKTTAARIIALALNCEKRPEYIVRNPNIKEPFKSIVEFNKNIPCCECTSCKSIINLNSFAVLELDAARTSDVATVRSILDDLPSAPMGGEPYKVLILDEAHNLSGKAEQALYKVLEDTPEHVYIILCTKYSEKLDEMTLNRCKATQFGRLENVYIYRLLEQVCQWEGLVFNKDILEYIAEESNGVPRQSLTYLQQIAAEGSWSKDTASLIINAGVDIDHVEVIDFCRLLIKERNFQSTVKAYSKIKKIPIEIIRMSVCGFFVGCLKRANNLKDAQQFSEIIDITSKPYFNNPKPEHILMNSLFKITQILRRTN
jgi:DNA polymerase-3 subunit gamma/tau